MDNDALKIKPDLSKLSVHILSKVLYPIGWSLDIEKSELVPNMDLDDFSKYLFDENIKAKRFFLDQALSKNYDNLKAILIDLKSETQEIKLAAPGILLPAVTKDNVEIDLVFHPFAGKKYLKLKADFLHSLINYIDQLLNINNQVDKKIEGTNGLTHRFEAIIFKYKAEAGYIENRFNPTEIENKFGAKRKQAIYTIWNKKGKTYKAPTVDELQIIIPHLSAYPNAQDAAINDLNKLN